MLARHFSTSSVILAWVTCVQSSFIEVIGWRTVSLLAVQVSKRQKAQLRDGTGIGVDQILLALLFDVWLQRIAGRMSLGLLLQAIGQEP